MEADASTEMSAFHRWFRASKVVARDGSPLVCYHGTKAAVTAFSRKLVGASDPGLVGKAFYFTPSREQAGEFASNPRYGKGDRPNVIPVYLSVQKPLVVHDGVLSDGRSLSDLHPQGITRQSAAAVSREVRSRHDGVLFYIGGELVQVAVFAPTQIKSVFNRGTWDPRNPDLSEAAE